MSSLELGGNANANIQAGAGRKGAATSFGCTIEGAGIGCLAGSDHRRINAVLFPAGGVGHFTGELFPQSR